MKRCKECGTKLYTWKDLCMNCYRVSVATKNPDNILLRQTVIDKLGGKCVNCQEDRLGCLDLDHIDGDGPLHRRELELLGYDKTYAIYNYLIEHNFKCEYKLQVLCRKCHNKKHRYVAHRKRVKIFVRNGMYLNWV